MKNDLIYLRHISEAIKKIELYLRGISYENLSRNNLILDAVVRELTIIGEAANQISEKFQKNTLGYLFMK